MDYVDRHYPALKGDESQEAKEERED